MVKKFFSYVNGKVRGGSAYHGAVRSKYDFRGTVLGYHEFVKFLKIPVEKQSILDADIRELRVSNTARYTLKPFSPEVTFTPDKNTVALYHFDEAQGDVLKDHSGNGHHGKIHGAKWVRLGEKPESDQSEENYALQFDGIDDYVTGIGPQVDFTKSFTLEVTVLPQSEAVDRGDGANILGNQLFGIRLWHNHKSWEAGLFKGEINARTFSSITSKPVTKTYLAVQSDGTEVRFFVNGQFAGNRKFSPEEIKSSPVLGADLKKSADGQIVTSNNFKGMIDEVRISNIARYADNYTPTDRLEADEHTLALYHFDEAQGDVLKDHSGDGHHGKIHGAKWVRVDGELNVIKDELSQLNADPVAADREVAEWVIENGGSVYLQAEDGSVQPAGQLSELPKSRFHLLRISFGRRTQLDDSTVTKIATLQGLNHLDLDGARPGNQILKILEHSNGLSSININATGIRASELLGMSSLRRLKQLAIQPGEIDSGWDFLKSFPNLRKLTLYGRMPLNYSELKNYPQLRQLYLSVEGASADVLDELQVANPKLRIILIDIDATISHPHGADTWIRSVEELMSDGIKIYGHLSTGGPQVLIKKSEWTQDQFLERLFRIVFPEGHQFSDNNAKSLDFFDRYLGGGGVIARKMKNTDQLALTLADWNLGAVRLENSDLTDEGLQSLSTISSLNNIDVTGTQVTEEAIKNFKQKRPLVFIKSDFGEFPPRVSFGSESRDLTGGA